MAGGHLQNAFIDILLTVGLDERSVSDQNSSSDASSEWPPVAGHPYRAQVLSVFSAQGDLSQATLQCDTQSQQQQNNPTSPTTKTIRRHRTVYQSDSRSSQKRKAGRFASFDGSDLRSRCARKLTTAVPDLPLSPNVIHSLTSFCFPDNAFVYSEAQEDYCHYLVLTDITGVRSYATCLTFWLPYCFTQVKGSSGQLEWEGSPETSVFMNGTEPASNGVQYQDKHVYLPFCCVVISKYPYFSVMKEALSLAVAKVKKDPEEMKAFLSDMALQLTSTPVPPAGELGVKFSLDGIQMVLPPAERPESPVTDIPLNLIFLSFSVQQVLHLVASIMTQQRIVFLSSDYSMLTVISQTLLTLIVPFKYEFTYVPVLPSMLVELIDAPGTFLMGCHSKHRVIINQVQGLVVADIEQGEVRVCSSLEVPQLPEFAVLPFKQAFSKLHLHYDMATVSRPPVFSYEEMRGSRQEFHNKFNLEIRAAFLELMVNLFRDVLPYVKTERMFFNKEAFLEGQPPSDVDFYAQVLQSDLFGQFLRDRLSQKMDQWAILEQKTRPKIRNSFAGGDDHHKIIRSLSQIRRESSAYSLCDFTQDYEQSDVEYIQLPFFTPDDADQYMEKCLIQYRSYIQTRDNVQQQASCHYMCGMLSLACGSLISCLEHFHHLSATQSSLFPVKLATELISKMTDMEKEVLKSTEFFKKSDVLKRLLDKKTDPAHQPIIMELDKVPQTDVDLQGFMEYIQMLEIAADHDAIVRLFEALTLGRKPVLDPTTFAVFYECWKEIERECTSKLPINEGFLDRNECILKVSGMTRSDHGMGRILLTQKRLFFLQEGSGKHKEIIKLRDINRIEKIQQHSFLKKVDALRIHSVHAKSNKEGFVMCLKESRNCWYMVVMEMWVGKIIAEELRDPAIIQQAAQNVLLVDALIRSGEENCTAHHSCVEQAAAHMCYFTSRKDDNKLTPETKDVLQHRINPNTCQADKSTVEALLYTPGNRSSLDEDIGPKLWCGMGSGKILIYDASTWLLDRQFIQARGRVVCLVAVDTTHVWAGSFDKGVYVIDAHTKVCNQTLMEHTDLVSDLAVSHDASTVYSASLNGQIIAWNAQTLQHRLVRHLVGVNSLKSVKCAGSELWCCTRQELIVFNTEGVMLRRLQHCDSRQNVIQIDSFLLNRYNQVWIGSSHTGEVVVYKADTLEKLHQVKILCRGISKMAAVHDKVWAGSKGGLIYIFDSVSLGLEKTLKAHTDSVRSICLAQNRYVMTGSGSADGKVAIWRTST